MIKAFVLLSGGLDSTVALARAVADRCDEVEGVSVNYGQRHSKEMTFAAKQCADRSLKHTILEIGDLLAGSMLTTAGAAIPDVTYDEIKGVSPTYVPFRNGLLLSIITAYAQKWVSEPQEEESPDRRHAVIYWGAHAEDAANWAYPDCTPEFIGAMANAIYIGSYQSIRLNAPLMSMKKDEIVRLGTSLDVDFANTWSCYAGGDLHCGKCPTCYARQEAFRKAGVKDPTVYAQPEPVVYRNSGPQIGSPVMTVNPKT